MLEVVYNAFDHVSEMQVYRAQNMELACKLHLTHHLPHQFHGHFSPEVFLN